MGPLASIDEWPAGRVGAAAILPDGTRLEHGSTGVVLPLASVTKPIVALAVLVAVEEGTLDLDEPAGPPGSTVRHLLAHASGLAPDDDAVLAPPSTRRIYSNHGFEVLGRLLAERAGTSTASYVREAVLDPLGMASTTLEGSPAHGARGSVTDLAALATELWRDDPILLARPTRDLATAVAWPGLPGVLPGFGAQVANDWGLGVEIRGAKRPHWTPDEASPATFGHFGRSGSVLWVDPVRSVALVVLSDREFGDWAPPLWRQLGASLLDAVGPGKSGAERQQSAHGADVERAVENQGSTP
jgi:CubicO group peptidase (beta-lactamase class C family)